MSKRVWLITGAGRGMGVDFARAASASGDAVVASGRDRERVSKVLGTSSDLLAVKLDVTSAADAQAALRAAVDCFGRIDVLVNNAASFMPVLRGTDARSNQPTDGGKPYRTDERHPRCLAGHAKAAIRPRHLDLLVRGPRRRVRS